MIKKLLPVIFLIVGAGAGVGAGLFLRPAPDPEAAAEMAEKAAMEAKEEEPVQFEYLKMSNQFVVPIVHDDRVASLIVMSLSLEVLPGTQQEVFASEPKLRDSFLQVMFDFANFGKFDGEFTDVSRLTDLREKLTKAAVRDVGDMIKDVLITEIARQDY